MNLFDEIRHHANIYNARAMMGPGMAAQAERDLRELMDITALMDEHPEQNGEVYDGPCICAVCRSYGP